ncbi:ABC transporter ATP-binding protein [Gorillibacterium sp. sgz5001074]|uniref:ABC transporter ATP-binding protein n=1 Tax=Gorillibacterium sp. sgz5001074 TaxID=3446695 RepID=UPI003F671C08
MKNEWILETEGLSKTIGRLQAVRGVNMKIRKGDIYGFLGPNGAGKTTTIRMLLGLAAPTSGRIQIFGRDVGQDRLKILQKVGSLVEYPSYYGHLTGYENLEAVRRLLGAPRSRIDDVLAVVRLTKDACRQVKGYSLGMKQRLGIAMALLGEPELLVLDEPTNGLDPAGIQEIRELIKGLPASHGVTVLISSHLLSEVEQMATRVGIIAKGSLIYQDEMSRLREAARSRIRFHVSEPEEACGHLLDLGIEASLESGRIAVPHAGDREVAGMVRELVRSGRDVYRVEEEGASLESLFLEMTGGEGSL